MQKRTLVVCGSRTWRDESVVESEMERLHQLEQYEQVATGGCPRGADAMAERIAHRLGLPVLSFIPDWARFGRGAGIIRNGEMLREARPIRVLAFWRNQSPGTWDTIKRARALGIPVTLIDNDRVVCPK